MAERHAGKPPDVEAVLSDMDATELEFWDPPAQVWEGVAAATAAGETAHKASVGRQRPNWWTSRRMGIAAAVLAVAGIATSLFFVLRDEPPAGSNEPATVLRSAELAYDASAFDPLGARARASVSLLKGGPGYVIDMAGANLPEPEPGADLEVWLIQPDPEGGVADLVSLGVVDPTDPGRLNVPTGHDPDIYSVVDISVEPRDGDPGHSGRSILRGALQN
ncbi:anti-sigma factor [Candidatus Poriferisocius sp.]|uniref:anti-sigma factor n=1 Tax=Candidatus Poriferisocius sp. TaxID=3101276 RepID=UPI003B0163D6